MNPFRMTLNRKDVLEDLQIPGRGRVLVVKIPLKEKLPEYGTTFWLGPSDPEHLQVVGLEVMRGIGGERHQENVGVNVKPVRA